MPSVQHLKYMLSGEFHLDLIPIHLTRDQILLFLLARDEMQEKRIKEIEKEVGVLKERIRKFG